MEGSRLLSGANYIKAMKIRGNLWHTQARGSRGRPMDTPMCDVGCNARETLGHQIQSCTRTHDEQVKRHNTVNDWVYHCLIKRGARCTRLEPQIATGEGLRKPDLFAACIAKGVVVLDTTITTDSCITTIAFRQKVDYF